MQELKIWEDETQLAEIRQIVSKSPLSDTEFKYLIGIGKATGLNPFLRELWAIKYDNKSAAQVFIGRDGYRKSAQQNPLYDYHQTDAVYSNDTFQVVNGEVQHSYNLANRGDLLGGYCVVQRRGSSKPMYVYVNLKDYDKRQSCWNSIKATMIAKVAEAQCLRMAFQEQFAGTLSEYEEPMIIDVTNSYKSSQSDKLQSLLQKKGLDNAQNSTVNADVNNIYYTDVNLADSGLCNTNSNPSPQASETEVRPGLAKDGESKDCLTDTQNVDFKATEYQLESIDLLLHERGFTSQRIYDALSHFKVKSFADMSQQQANEMIKILNKVDIPS
jgi:phage recombination protein Bet